MRNDLEMENWKCEIRCALVTLLDIDFLHAIVIFGRMLFIMCHKLNKIKTSKKEMQS